MIKMNQLEKSDIFKTRSDASEAIAVAAPASKTVKKAKAQQKTTPSQKPLPSAQKPLPSAQKPSSSAQKPIEDEKLSNLMKENYLFDKDFIKLVSGNTNYDEFLKPFSSSVLFNPQQVSSGQDDNLPEVFRNTSSSGFMPMTNTSAPHVNNFFQEAPQQFSAPRQTSDSFRPTQSVQTPYGGNGIPTPNGSQMPNMMGIPLGSTPGMNNMPPGMNNMPPGMNNMPPGMNMSPGMNNMPPGMNNMPPGMNGMPPGMHPALMGNQGFQQYPGMNMPHGMQNMQMMGFGGFKNKEDMPEFLQNIYNETPEFLR